MSLIRTRKKIVSSAIASSLSMIATTAMAQETVSQLPTIHTQATHEESLKVDESANSKLVAPLLDTPKSVSILSQKLIKDSNSNTLLEALRYEPGITLGAGEGGTPFTDMPYIRGYSAQSSVYVDGVRNSTSQNRDMFAIEQVEVIKGSSSALGGGGGVGGSINLIPKVAHEGDVYQGSVQGGTDNYRHIQLDANKDFGNGVAGRVVVMGHENEKAGSNGGAEYARAGIASSLAFGLDTATRGTLSYYYLHSNDEPDAGIPFLPVGGKPIDVKQGMYYGWKARDFDKRENHIGTFKLEHDLADDLTLSNTMSYTKSKSDYIYTNADDSKGNVTKNGTISRRALSRIVDTDAYSDQLALKGKFNTGTLKHSFNTGAEWSYQQSNQGVYTFTDASGTTSTVHNTSCPVSSALSNGWCTSVNNPMNGAFTDTLGSIKNQYTTRSRTVSLYALDSIEFNPQWLLNLGVRWDKFETERKYNKNIYKTVKDIDKTSTSGNYTNDVSIAAGQKFENDSDYFSYQAGLVYKPTENGSIYASFATSANPVGVDQGDGADALSTSSQQANDLSPEKARTFEVGTKWDLFNNRANLTAAIFRTEKQNTRIAIDANTTTNAGESKVDGFEVGFNGKVTDKWEVSAGYSYLDSELTKAAYNAVAQEGKPLPFVAKNSATLWSTYRVLPKLTLGAGAEYRDKVFTNTNTGATMLEDKYLPTYTIYNAMAKYDVNKNVNLQLNINNISDKRYFTSAHPAHYAFEGNGRNAVLAINFKY
ncbi:TonB-dependent receptor [Acinetobacter nosocomialis]|uniref:TonB-dependent siderophore receptor n=1 Tax=Acinetobacter nosocomialis TaxID=106654 RepID=A0A2L1VK43_ACINO|nr:TonB-dependent siderophore receptor [Acinetobacter nosocomialis]ARG18338.1 TonB-dependent siderophore receptor [Acinetobacter nosocomialis]AVF45583.1 TonB-dependent siderophore receptor [Acinetobacter nosocomialis]MBM9551392.1 TonB-dependent siderophore receptor [Acinetobacter nosocomialis]MBP1471747.1 TonB-dependent siderophore receptor [Acinetobacter nosocomialis]MBP1501033.1 TonB-dependent siderophore receptor [Acinetobacter nosocomialis]